MKKNLICISCPIGCHLTVKQDKENNITVTGNRCNRGELYGKEEVSAPKRTVTAVVKVKDCNHVYIPVKTDKPILKTEIFNLLKTIYQCSIALPVKRGDVLIKNYNNTDINIRFTRSMKKNN